MISRRDFLRMAGLTATWPCTGAWYASRQPTRSAGTTTTRAIHGTAAPLFVFGTQVIAGIHGHDPKLDTGSLMNGNLTYDNLYDFRNVYATAMSEWLSVDDTSIENILTASNGQTYSKINTWTHLRPQLSDRARADELGHWRARAAAPTFRDDLWRAVATCFARESVRFELDLDSALHGAEHAKSAMMQLHQSLERSQASLAASMAECAQARLEAAQLETQRSAVTAELAAMKDSTSWRLTYPVRQAGRVMAKFHR